MGETRPMQPLITVKAKKQSAGVTAGNVVQPAQGWGDAKDAKDAVFHVQILGHVGTSTRMPKLLLETATSAAGPWRAIAFWDGATAPPINVAVGASTRAPGFSGSENLLERFYRWKIDASALDVANDTWAMCFGICVTLK